ncbi:MAG TPA: hypothetical protein VGG28_12835, partial [Kofleriaceae bacterium]
MRIILLITAATLAACTEQPTLTKAPPLDPTEDLTNTPCATYGEPDTVFEDFAFRLFATAQRARA